MKNKKLSKYLSLINKSIFSLIIILGVYFVFGVNDLSIKGFVLQEVKNEVSRYEDQNRELELKVMELESYENLSKRAVELNMVKVGKVDYISVENGVVAVR